MRTGKRSLRAFTVIETMCVIAIVATLCSLAMPVFRSVRERSKVSGSMSNMHQMQLALRMYCDEGSGGVDSLPYDFFKVRAGLGLPESVLHTGGRNMFPAYKSDVYLFTWPSVLDRAEEDASVWRRYVEATLNNPVLIIDDTFPEASATGPFVKTMHTGAFWNGEVVRRRYGGLSTNLLENWR